MKTKLGLQGLSLSVYITILTVLVGYSIKPELFGIRSAFSSLGAFPPTSYIFTAGFVLASLLLAYDALYTKTKFQKVCRFIASIGYIMLGVFQIEHGQLRGDLHRLGGLVMMLAAIISMIGHVISEWGCSSLKRKALYATFAGMALVSVVMSILSSAQFKVMALQGLAQYIGLLSLIGWAILDSSSETNLQ